jgi:hypothetical protein
MHSHAFVLLAGRSSAHTIFIFGSMDGLQVVKAELSRVQVYVVILVGTTVVYAILRVSYALS